MNDGRITVPGDVEIEPLVVEEGNESVSWRRFMRRWGIATAGADWSSLSGGGDPIQGESEVQRMRRERLDDEREREGDCMKGLTFITTMGRVGFECIEEWGLEPEQLCFSYIVGRFERRFSAVGIQRGATQGAEGIDQLGEKLVGLHEPVCQKSGSHRGVEQEMGGNRRGMKTCFVCGEGGHISFNCPKRYVDRYGNRVNGKTCFVCGEGGHMSFSCSKRGVEQETGGNRRGVKTCFVCGEGGHISFNCSRRGVEQEMCGNRRGAKTCFVCGERGHNITFGWSVGDEEQVLCREDMEEGSAEVNEAGEMVQGTDAHGVRDGSDLVNHIHERPERAAERGEFNTYVWVGNMMVDFVVDTGADVTVLTEHESSRLGLILRKPETVLRGAGGNDLQVVGETRVVMKSEGGLITGAKVSVVRGARANLLGVPEINALQLVRVVNGIREEVEKNYPGLYRGLGSLPDTFEIRVREGAIPRAIPVPRRVPAGLREATEKELDRMLSMGVIERVDEPSEWCSGMVVAPKSSGKVRICVDLTELNKSVQREHFPLPHLDDMLSQLEGAKWFSKMDANSGFWQVEMAESSRPLTTFITPFGRFRFRKMPFGISAAPEFFQRQMEKILEGEKGVVCMMDDVLVFGDTEEIHNARLRSVLGKLEGAGLTLNREKCEFGVDRVTFLGHVVSGEGVEVDPEKVRAITEMIPPSNRKELKRFLGMVGYLGKFSARLSELQGPLRALLGKESDWAWGCAQRQAFEAIKRELTSAPVLTSFRLGGKHRLTADASRASLGAALLQADGEGGWQPVAYISRAMTPAETRYAQIEKEALAITWACEKLDFYLVGNFFEIETDHKPLVQLLGVKDLSGLPLRVQRFRMRLMRYRYDIFHTPGTEMFLADLLSRPAQGDARVAVRAVRVDARVAVKEERVERHVRAIVQAMESDRDPWMAQVREEGARDDEYRMALRYSEGQWPSGSKGLSPGLRALQTHQAQLSAKDGFLLMGGRVVIPAALRAQMLHRIHRGHQGIEKCWRRAGETIWWPGMRGAIEKTVTECNECIKKRRMAHQPLEPTPLPAGPWEEVGSDCFEFRGRHYLLVVDYYSRWIEVAEMGRMDSATLIKKLRPIFARLGNPKLLRSDNGPNYRGRELQGVLGEMGVQQVTSSPHYPESNGLAERAVQTIKGMWGKEDDKNLALQMYRSTPLQSGWSPAELLYGRNIRTNLPGVGAREVDREAFRETEEAAKRKMKSYTDRRRRAKGMKSLKKGDRVWVKIPSDKVGKEGTVLERAYEPESYWVRTESGTVRRNRKHLRLLFDEASLRRGGGTIGLGPLGGETRDPYGGGEFSKGDGGESSGSEGDEEDDSNVDWGELPGNRDGDQGNLAVGVPDNLADIADGGAQRRSTRVGGRGHLRDDHVYY